MAMVPGTAWAPKVFHRTRVTGTCTAAFGAGTFAGEIELTHFDAVGDSLTVTALLSGNCARDSATWVDVTAQSVSMAATALTASCEEFLFTVGGSLALAQSTVALDAVSIPIQAAKATGKRLCVIDRHLDAGRLGPVAHILNTLI